MRSLVRSQHSSPVPIYMGILFLNARRRVRHLPKGESRLSLLFKLSWWQERHKYESPRYARYPNNSLKGEVFAADGKRRFTKENSYEGKPCRCAFSLGKASSKAATNNQHRTANRVDGLEGPNDCRAPKHTAFKSHQTAHRVTAIMLSARRASHVIESGGFL